MAAQPHPRRGTSTARRPNVADMLCRVVAVCVAAERLLADHRVVSRAAAAKELARQMRSRSSGDLATLAPVVLSRLVSSLPPVRSNLVLFRYVSSGRFRDDLAAVYAAVPPVDGSDLAGHVARLADEGVDVADLFDAVITFESHEHINLVWHQAHRYAPRLRCAPEDLFGFGWHGLKVALSRYDPTRTAFSTYACACIVSKIRDGVRAEMPIVKKMLTLRNKVTAAEVLLSAELGRVPTLEEVASHLDEDVARLKLLNVQLGIADAVSIDEVVDADGDGGFTPGWMADDAPSAEELVVAGERRERVQAALASLDRSDAELVSLLVLEGVPLRQVCDRLGLTPRQVRQHRARVFAELAERLDDLSEAALAS